MDLPKSTKMDYAKSTKTDILSLLKKQEPTLTKLDAKLEEAIQLYADKEIGASLNIFNELCRSKFDNTSKLKIIIAFYDIAPQDAYDMITRWRDLLGFYKGDEFDEQVDLLMMLCKSPKVDPMRRIECAVSLYNNHVIHICYDAFQSIMEDTNVPALLRVEAVKYLLASMNEAYRELAIGLLVAIINNLSLASDFRYKTIASFHSRTGINTFTNATKLKVPLDEDLLHTLETTFFWERSNDIKDRILAAQVILQLKLSSSELKSKVTQELLAIAQNDLLSENTKADAADVVLRLGDDVSMRKARDIITLLGYSGLGKGKKTIYNNSQNAHSFTEQADAVIEELLVSYKASNKTYYDVHNEVLNRAKELDITKDDENAVKRALNRISVDTATFTKRNLTISDVFVVVWDKIQSYKEPELEKRMIEELMDMKDTCSSGHCIRFVNALSHHINTFTISWEEQIVANISGRMKARIRDCKDEEVKYALAMADSELAEEEDKVIYRKFIFANLVELERELREEFVGGGYVVESVFKGAFDKGAKGW